jgi:hypothetical protein
LGSEETLVPPNFNTIQGSEVPMVDRAIKVRRRRLRVDPWRVSYPP